MPVVQYNDVCIVNTQKQLDEWKRDMPRRKEEARIEWLTKFAPRGTGLARQARHAARQAKR